MWHMRDGNAGKQIKNGGAVKEKMIRMSGDYNRHHTHKQIKMC